MGVITKRAPCTNKQTLPSLTNGTRYHDLYKRRDCDHYKEAVHIDADADIGVNGEDDANLADRGMYRWGEKKGK